MTPSFEKSPVAYLAYQRARMNAIQARAEAKLGQLGKETASRSKGMTGAEAHERDARSLKRIASIWRRRPNLMPGPGRTTTVTLASGRRIAWDSENEKWVKAR